MSVSSGIAMEIHYCMGEKSGLDFYASGSNTCSRCGMEEKKGGCCSDDHKFYKLADEHKNVTNDHTFKIPFPAPLFNFQYSHENTVLLISSLFPIIQAPIDSGPPLYLAYNVFRI